MNEVLIACIAGASGFALGGLVTEMHIIKNISDAIERQNVRRFLYKSGGY